MFNHKIEKSIYTLAALFSLIISYLIYYQIDVINPDAVCYLQSAQRMPQSVHAAMALCDQANWPFYSFLIYQWVKVTGLSYIAAAFSLNAIFSMITVLSFMQIVALISPLHTRKTMLWLAAFVILTAKTFNDVRQYIVRDHGYWACCFLGILLLLHLFRMQKSGFKKYWLAFCWGIISVVAMLFRIEGIIFLGLIPFSVWWVNSIPLKQRAQIFLALQTVNILGFISFIFWWQLHPELNIGRLHEVTLSRFTDFIQSYQSHAALLGNYVLSHYAKGDEVLVFFLMVIVWYVILMVKNLTFINSGLFLVAWIKRTLPLTFNDRCVLLSYIAINVLLTLVFLMQNLFLSKRYLISLALLLLLWVPSALYYFLRYWSGSRWPLRLIVVVLCLYGIRGVIPGGYSKAYIKEAGIWVKNNVPVDARFYSNDILVKFYTGHFTDQLFSKDRSMSVIQKADYVALRVNKKDRVTLQPILLSFRDKPIMTFANNRGDEVRIYRR